MILVKFIDMGYILLWDIVRVLKFFAVCYGLLLASTSSLTRGKRTKAES